MESYRDIGKLDELTEKYQNEARDSKGDWVPYLKVCIGDLLMYILTTWVSKLFVIGMYNEYNEYCGIVFRLMGWPTDALPENLQQK